MTKKSRELANYVAILHPSSRSLPQRQFASHNTFRTDASSLWLTSKLNLELAPVSLSALIPSWARRSVSGFQLQFRSNRHPIRFGVPPPPPPPRAFVVRRDTLPPSFNRNPDARRILWTATASDVALAIYAFIHCVAGRIEDAVKRRSSAAPLTREPSLSTIEMLSPF